MLSRGLVALLQLFGGLRILLVDVTLTLAGISNGQYLMFIGLETRLSMSLRG